MKHFAILRVCNRLYFQTFRRFRMLYNHRSGNRIRVLAYIDGIRVIFTNLKYILVCLCYALTYIRNSCHVFAVNLCACLIIYDDRIILRALFFYGKTKSAFINRMCCCRTFCRKCFPEFQRNVDGSRSFVCIRNDKVICFVTVDIFLTFDSLNIARILVNRNFFNAVLVLFTIRIITRKVVHFKFPAIAFYLNRTDFLTVSKHFQCNRRRADIVSICTVSLPNLLTGKFDFCRQSVRYRKGNLLILHIFGDGRRILFVWRFLNCIVYLTSVFVIHRKISETVVPAGFA